MWKTTGFIRLYIFVIDDAKEIVIAEKAQRRSSSLKCEEFEGSFSLLLSVTNYAECEAVNISERVIRLIAWKLIIYEL
jgi:hypothetical protein